MPTMRAKRSTQGQCQSGLLGLLGQAQAEVQPSMWVCPIPLGMGRPAHLLPGAEAAGRGRSASWTIASFGLVSLKPVSSSVSALLAHRVPVPGQAWQGVMGGLAK